MKHLNFSPSIGRHKALILVKAAFAGKEMGLGKETLHDRGLYALEFILHPFMIILWPISGVEEPTTEIHISITQELHQAWSEIKKINPRVTTM